MKLERQKHPRVREEMRKATAERRALKEGMMPRPKDLEPKPQLSNYSPLAAYMRLAEVNAYAVGQATGLSVKVINDLMRGDHEPSVSTAYLLEIVTKGAVPMSAWVGLPKIRARIARLTAELPDEVRRLFVLSAKSPLLGRRSKGEEDNEN